MPQSLWVLKIPHSLYYFSSPLLHFLELIYIRFPVRCPDKLTYVSFRYFTGYGRTAVRTQERWVILLQLCCKFIFFSACVPKILFRCPLHREGRICMLNLIKSICVSWKDKTHLDISEFLLLAPTSNGCGSNKDNKMIKAAVFEFIETSGRKL